MRALADDPYFLALIIDLNTKHQLFEQGIDSDGNALRSAITGADGYSQFSVALKRAAGLPFDHFTLYEDGDFYRSWRVMLDANADLIIDANTQKPDQDLADTFGPKIIGLTDESLTKLEEYALEQVVPIIIDILTAA